jgi:surface carbohydrate biosynthesis protein (TIGR04326 family)
LTKYNSEKSKKKPLHILVFGDFLSSTNRSIFACLEVVAKSLPNNTVFLFRAHPAYPLKTMDYPELKLVVAEGSLIDLFNQSDVAFTSNITSAAVDAYSFGLPVIQMLDGNSFNTSPLRGLSNVIYISTPLQMLKALEELKYYKVKKIDPYFYFNDNLERWKKLLSNA